MTINHTPGPWVIGKQDHDVVMVDTTSGTAICDVYGDSDERPANARLIAAAPDLLAALHRISLASQNSMSSKEECGRIAREAIAKVKG